MPDKIYIFPQKLRQTVQLMANKFYLLLVLIDRNNSVIDVINLGLFTVATGTKPTGQIYPVQALENIING